MTGLECMPFTVHLQSNELAVREALNELRSGLGTYSLETEEISTVEIVLAEILNNIVEHAYPAKSEGGPIDISCSSQLNGLHLRIKDRGKPMPDGHVPLSKPQSIDVPTEEIPEGGFGWFIIQDLAKDVSYERHGDENELTLRIAVGMG